jgi:hypothetical protein
MPTNQPPLHDRRRSSRATVSIPLLATGKAASGGEFRLATHTHTVSQFGCLILLDAELFLDQLIQLHRPELNQSLEGKVVSRWRRPDGKLFVGISFTESAQDFWGLAFAQE